MSALPPKADMLGVKIKVCFVPQADSQAQNLMNRCGMSLMPGTGV